MIAMMLRHGAVAAPSDEANDSVASRLSSKPIAKGGN